MINKFKKWLWALIFPPVMAAGFAIDANINPYEQVGDVYSITQQERKVEIKEEGDYITADLTHWDGEVSLKVKRKLEKKSKLKRDTFSNKLKTKNKTEEINLYPLEDGFEFEVILYEKPKSNVISLEIESEGLDFFYQPELTQEEIDEGSFRPENIVGSYAVYHSTKRDYIVGQKNYKTGKFGHLYKPRMCDSNNWCVWGEFNDDLQVTKILTNTLPINFWNNAVYPIGHATGLTFGFDGDGGTVGYYINDYVLNQGISTAGAGDEILVKISARLKSSSAKNAKTATYDDNLDLVDTSNEVSITDASYAWYDFTVTEGSTAPTTRVILVMGAEAGSKTTYSSYDAVTGAWGAGSWSYTSFPPNSVQDPASSNRLHSIYATYESGGGAEDYIPSQSQVIY